MDARNLVVVELDAQPRRFHARPQVHAVGGKQLAFSRRDGCHLDVCTAVHIDVASAAVQLGRVDCGYVSGQRMTEPCGISRARRDSRKVFSQMLARKHVALKTFMSRSAKDFGAVAADF